MSVGFYIMFIGLLTRRYIEQTPLLPLVQVFPGLGRPMSLRNRVKRVEKKVRRETEIVKH
jgi:hypothetical protein